MAHILIIDDDVELFSLLNAYPMDRSLDMLVSRLRKKLGPRKDGGERIKAVRGEGYVYLLTGEI